MKPMSQKLAQRLTFKHLRLIAAIAEHRQLSLAAQVLALTQPAASRTLGEIEQPLRRARSSSATRAA